MFGVWVIMVQVERQ